MLRFRILNAVWRQLRLQGSAGSTLFEQEAFGSASAASTTRFLSSLCYFPPKTVVDESWKWGVGSVRWDSSQRQARRERARRRQLPTERRNIVPTEGGGNEVQPVEGLASEVQVSSVVNHPALIITRAIEWGTVLLGFEQANKYTVLDQDGKTVALIAEDMTGIGDAVGRQLLRTRRSFTATVFSADGSQVVFRIRRPMYLISSTMYVEDGEGTVIGEIRQRWHLFKRNYDLYLDKTQFAEISGTFLAWEFELKNSQGGTLALIDRNFLGFGKEIFTDAGKYVIHFGQQPVEAVDQVTKTIQARSNNPDLPPVTSVAKLRTDVQVIPTYSGNQLVVARKLQLSERMLALACAMTIDFDYFSRHSGTSGWLTPPLIIPMGGGGDDAPADAADPAAAGPAVAGQEEATTGPETVLGGEEAPSEAEGEWLDSGEDFDVGGDGGGGGLWGGISDILSGGDM